MHELDEIVATKKKLEGLKESFFKEKLEADKRYRAICGKLKVTNLEFMRIMAKTRQSRRIYPEPNREWKQEIIDERPFCEVCGSNEKLNLQVHHKVPLSRGGSNAKENIKILCRECHQKAHRLE